MAVDATPAPAPSSQAPARAKILFPFVGSELSERALQATLRLARAEHAVVVPAYLATVPLPLTLDAPVGRACDQAFAVFEAIERRAAESACPSTAASRAAATCATRLRELITEVPGATRIVVAASTDGGHDGFGVDDVAWLLRNAPGEVLVVRRGRHPQSLARPGRTDQDRLLHARPCLPTRPASTARAASAMAPAMVP